MKDLGFTHRIWDFPCLIGTIKKAVFPSMATQFFSNGIPTGMPKCPGIPGVAPPRSFGVRNPALVKVRGVEKNEAWIGETSSDHQLDHLPSGNLT